MNNEHIHVFPRPIPEEVQRKILERLHYVCTHIEEFAAKLDECKPKIKHPFPVLNGSEIVKVNPIPRNNESNTIKTKIRFC